MYQNNFIVLRVLSLSTYGCVPRWQCVCVCVCARARARVCVCVCVCVTPKNRNFHEQLTNRLLKRDRKNKESKPEKKLMDETDLNMTNTFSFLSLSFFLSSSSSSSSSVLLLSCYFMLLFCLSVFVFVSVLSSCCCCLFFRFVFSYSSYTRDWQTFCAT